MSQKRMYVDGVIYFVTSRTFDHKKIFIDDFACRLFLEVLDYYHKRMKFRLYAFNVLPTHVHKLILPRGKYNISEINHRIKGSFAKKYLEYLRNHDKCLRNHKGSVTERRIVSQISVGEPSWFAIGKRRRIRINPIWQKSFHDRIIRSDEELYNTIDYISYNAV